MRRRKALFIDADYAVREGKCYARLLVKGKKTATLYFQYDPYFYADVDEAGRKAIESLSVKGKDGTPISPKRTEFAERILDGEPKRLLRVLCHEPHHVPILREAIPFPCYEYGIHYGRRFMMDFSLVPFSVISYEREGRQIRRFLKSSPGDPRMLKRLAFDTEVYNPVGAPRPSKDPIIMFSFADSSGAKGVVTYRDGKGGNVELVDDEKRMLERFFLLLSEKDVDVLYGYNTTNFDLPYIAERAKKLGIPLALGRDGSPYRTIKKGMVTPLKIRGRVHVDLYPVMKFFGFTGLIRTDDYTLKNVYATVTGKKATKIDRMDIWRQWDSGDIATLTDYALADSLATVELGEMAYPLLAELSTITRMPLFDVAYATSGQLVESLLMSEAAAHRMIIPPKPGGSAVAARIENPIQGAYVKLPEPGIYDNIAVFDFRGLYPSIICSYNIDPFTLDKPGESFESPTHAKFAKSPRGLIPLVLESLIDHRVLIKRELKSAEKDTEEYKLLSARSHALKILANSFYGYLGYARSRWYSRKCAESVTAWGRMHILAAEEKAKAAGFEVMYMDSLPYDRHIFVEAPNGTFDIVKIGEFVKKNGHNRDISAYKTLAYDGKELVFKPILKAIEHGYDSGEKGKLLEFVTDHGKTVVTPQHSVYYFDANEKTIKLADAKKLKSGDSLISLTNPVLPESRKEGELIDVLSLDFGLYKDQLRAYCDNTRFPLGSSGKCPYCKKQVESLHSHVSLRHQVRKLKIEEAKKTNCRFVGGKNARTGRIPRYWKLTPELAWIMGYYCAEGSASERSNNHNKLMVSFGSQDKGTIERVKRFFDGILGEELGLIEHLDKRINKKMYYYRIQRTPMVALFKHGFDLGSKSSGKRVPPIIYSAEKGLKKAFLEGYLEGDGTKYADKRYRTHFISFTTKSKELAIGLHILLKSLGHGKNSFGKVLEHVHWTYRKDKPGIQALRLQGVRRGAPDFENFCPARIKEINEIDEMDSVFDLEVEGTHNFVDAEGLILVHNTDSLFLLLGEKKREDAMDFLEKINKELPEKMELELEGFYTRGVFVSKKGEEKGAKKKYALLGDDGRVKIRGFELVRRDWSAVAKTTQRRVLEAILREGSKERAVAIVREMVEQLRSGKVPLSDLAIYTQLKKDPSNYDILSPELSAAQKAIKRGKPIERGSIIGYVITRKGKSISDKAELLEFAPDYDPDYYINNQVLPSVLKILKELGADEYELTHGGRQKGMSDFF